MSYKNILSEEQVDRVIHMMKNETDSKTMGFDGDNPGIYNTRMNIWAAASLSFEDAVCVAINIDEETYYIDYRTPETLKIIIDAFWDKVSDYKMINDLK